MNSRRPLWRLRHGWHAASDIAALGVCAEALAVRGMQLARAHDGEAADAVKWHGGALAEAGVRGGFELADLSQLARHRAWERSLPPLVRAFMRHGARWHGIPVAVHRSDCAWVRSPPAREAPADWPALVHWLEAARSGCRWPLALGREPWMLGLVFENAVLSIAGAARYWRAFVRRDPGALRDPAMVAAVAAWLDMHRFVDERQLHLGWAAQVRRVVERSAAIVFCGDWVRAAWPGRLCGWACPGASALVAVVDYLVPLAGRTDTDPAGQRAVAAASALVQPGVLQRVAALKGASSPFDLPGVPALPSLSFEQAFAPSATQEFLALLSRHFMEQPSAGQTAGVLADWVASHPVPAADFLFQELERSIFDVAVSPTGLSQAPT